MEAYSHQIKESARWVAQVADVSEERARWAVGAVISRSFAAEEVRAMVPLADIFNHKPQLPADVVEGEGDMSPAWRLSEDGSHFEVRAMEDANVDEEVLISYGEETSAEILAVHGMVLAENEADYLEIFESPDDLLVAVETLLDCPGRRKQRQFEFETMDADYVPLALRPGGPRACEHLLGCVEAALCKDDEFRDFRQWSENDGYGILRIAGLPEVRQRELRREALDFISQIVQGFLQQWDEALEPASLPPDGSGSQRPSPAVLAAKYRQHVRAMLAEFLELADNETG
ncbi:unnamed protein product [Symbiodinium sp. CCMP2456]|nr:unnamed protein product [Symbiodinium sp. CCMP2456]